MRKITAHAALFLVFLLAVTTVFAQRRASRRVASRTVYTPPKFTPTDIEEEPLDPPKPENVPAGRPETRLTQKLNAGNRCEAYPWLSSDGLRLYFTSNRDGGHGNIYLSERASVNDAFEKVEKVFNTKDNRYYAASLTTDELTMYLTLEGYTLYIAERKSREEPFSTPRVIPELKDRKLYGPGISADGSEMIVIDYSTNTRQPAYFIKDENGKFVEKRRLRVTEGMVAGAGQLSKDGLTYYCSFEDNSRNGENIYRFTRNAAGGEFTLAGIMGDEVNRARKNLQPSVNGDGTLMAYVINEDGMWAGDDIRVVALNGSKMPEEEQILLAAVKQALIAPTVKLNSADIKAGPVNIARISLPVAVQTVTTPASVVIRSGGVGIYPNPFTDQLFIEFPKTLTEKVLLELFDANGKRVLAHQIPPYGSVAQVNTGRLPAGQYTCRISGKDGIIYSGTLISGK